MATKEVPYTTEDRQWDIRINVQCDDYLQQLVENIMMEDKDKTNSSIYLLGDWKLGHDLNIQTIKCDTSMWLLSFITEHQNHPLLTIGESKKGMGIIWYQEIVNNHTVDGVITISKSFPKSQPLIQTALSFMKMELYQ